MLLSITALSLDKTGNERRFAARLSSNDINITATITLWDGPNGLGTYDNPIDAILSPLALGWAEKLSQHERNRLLQAIVSACNSAAPVIYCI